MTLQEILTKYNSMKQDARKRNNWKELDEFVEELAQLASGTPIITSDFIDEQFNEVRVR